MATDACGSPPSSFETNDAVASSPAESHLATSPAASSTWSPGPGAPRAGGASSTGSDQPRIAVAARTVHRFIDAQWPTRRTLELRSERPKSADEAGIQLRYLSRWCIQLWFRWQSLCSGRVVRFELFEGGSDDGHAIDADEDPRNHRVLLDHEDHRHDARRDRRRPPGPDDEGRLRREHADSARHHAEHARGPVTAAPVQPGAVLDGHRHHEHGRQ